MEVRLRYFQTYDENGLDSEQELQYWDGEDWITVNTIRVAEADALMYLSVNDC